MYLKDALVRGRYRVIAPLGEGRHGVVWRAHDALKPREVALKVLRAPEDLAFLARRELTALRLEELPGVVRLLDDGMISQDGPPFLVMELVEGPPLFPASGQRVAWSALRPGVLALLRTLRALHAAGVVHRDLKPEHVRLDAAGRPVLLDFSAAAGPGVDLTPLPGRLQIGSLRTMAPEQLVDAERVDGRSDLYALGVMLYEALSGEAPHPETHPDALRAARLSRPAPPLRVAGLPDDVAALIDRMLSRQRRDRPASAEEVLAALGAGARDELDRAFAHWGPGTLSEDGLRALFAGPDRLLHRQEDAARLVFAATGGRREAVAALLSGWLASGQASWLGGGIRLSERLFEDARAFGQRAREVGPEAVFLALREEVATLISLGRTREAVARAELALELARRGHGSEEAALLDRAKLALIGGLGIGPALYELERSAARSEALTVVAALLHAARAARAGRVDDAPALLQALPPLADPGLDRWRPALWVDLAQNSEDDNLVEQAERFVADWAASHPDAQADVDGWKGLLAYRRGDMPRAAALSKAAAAAKDPVGAQLSAGLNAVMALLDGGQPAAARDEAARLLARARPLRLTIYEVRAEGFLRAARYRLDEAGPVDWELVEAARCLEPPLWGAGLLFTEAAVAWRRGELHAAATLAGEAHRAWSGRADPDTLALADALARACAGELPDPPRVLAIRRPGLALQALGLLLWREPALRDRFQAVAEKMASELPPYLAAGRRELMSVQEILKGVHRSGVRAM